MEVVEVGRWGGGLTLAAGKVKVRRHNGQHNLGRARQRHTSSTIHAAPLIDNSEVTGVMTTQ